mmetsp:Transcript_34933/g.79755  ORF Transcript_34933/g.79755 Transcript_34933/m.79755 type:complete len:138 (+) Transcript_34933:753-1166(+)
MSSFAASSHALGSLEVKITFAPSLTKAFATINPMPRELPVTKMFLPATLKRPDMVAWKFLLDNSRPDARRFDLAQVSKLWLIPPLGTMVPGTSAVTDNRDNPGPLSRYFVDSCGGCWSCVVSSTAVLLFLDEPDNVQ